MKIYNKKLEEIENDEMNLYVSKLAKENIEFLQEKYNIDKNMLLERFEKMSIVIKEGKEHSVTKNGELYKVGSAHAAAFVTKKNQEFDGRKWLFENALYINNNNSNDVIIHELFHALSTNMEMDYNVENIGYDKAGIRSSGYDEDDKVVDVSMDADGLNEGVTEMLTMELKGKKRNSLYISQVYLAQILVNSQNNDLIKAYFSKDSESFREFLNGFDKRQNVISSKKLVEISNSNQGDMDVDVLKGCLEYSLSFCQTMNQFQVEKEKLKSVCQRINNDFKIQFSDESFNIRMYFEELIEKKLNEIEQKSISIKEIGKETINTPTKNKENARIKLNKDMQNLQNQISHKQNVGRDIGR